MPVRRYRHTLSSRAASCHSLLLLLLPGCVAFNLDVSQPAVYSGPQGSHFGYSVDFYSPDQNTVNILVGAPKANTSQPRIVEGGAVYFCSWAAGGAPCSQIPFDKSSNRTIKVNGTKEPVEFKSNQWFGATVKSHKGKVVACAPLYHWRTFKLTQEKDPVGTCYVAVHNFSDYAEYSPCRSGLEDPEGQGYCQAGFSLDFTQDGNLVLGGPGSFYWQEFTVQKEAIRPIGSAPALGKSILLKPIPPPYPRNPVTPPNLLDTKGQFNMVNPLDLHIFGLWEGTPGGNQRRHGEKVQIPHRQSSEARIESGTLEL